jgi:hypothetical protein
LKLTPESLHKVCGRKVKGATMWHVLEHMPSCNIAHNVFQNVATLVEDFISFRGPAFDSHEVLQQLGFLRYYEDWHGHTCHLTSSLLLKAMRNSNRTSAAVVVLSKNIASSSIDVILPIGSARDSHRYNSSRHPAKSVVSFDFALFEEMRACTIFNAEAMSLHSALCLRDALPSGLKDDARIVYCINELSLSEDDCVESLRSLAHETIQYYLTLSAEELRISFR